MQYKASLDTLLAMLDEHPSTYVSTNRILTRMTTYEGCEVQGKIHECKIIYLWLIGVVEVGVNVLKSAAHPELGVNDRHP